MNEFIKPIFETILPAIESAGIKYWIYGGVGNAAMVGKFYRSNPDLDMFVLGDDFEKTESILSDICKENNWKICNEFVNGRQKIEVFLLKNNKKWIERLSVIPAYKKEGYVELKFKNGPGEYPLDILNQEQRCLDGCNFSTLNNSYLKKLFIEYLNSKSKYPPKRIDDARHILSEEEFKKYFPNIVYKP